MANKGRPGRGNCSVCRGVHRAQVDIGLTSGMSCKALAERFGYSPDSVERHSKAHLLPQMRAAILAGQHPSLVDLDALRTSESEGLLANVLSQRARLHSIGEFAMETGDTRAAIAVEAAVTSNLSLAAKLLGQLTTVVDHRHTSLLLTPDYLQLREAMFNALQPFPDAARAVAKALHQLESSAAQDITARAVRPSKAAAPAPLVIEHVAAPPVPPPPPIYVPAPAPPIVPPAAPLSPPPPWPGRPC